MSLVDFNQLHHGDSIEGMDALPAGSVDLVFADPPFNIGYEYDVYSDALGYAPYLDWSRRWIGAVHRALKPDGTFWLAIGDEYAAELKLESQKIGFHCRSWVIWYYTFGVNCVNKFTRSHAHLFHFVKDPRSFTFRADELENRIPSARQLVYNDARANPRGRLPDDTWIIGPAAPPPEGLPDTWVLRPQDLSECLKPEEDTWYFPRVNGTFKERAGFHGCQMPEQLLGRIIRVCSNPGDLVLDPFSGSATTLAVAKKLGRRHLGFDISSEYVEQGRRRLAGVFVGDPLDGSPEPTMSAPKTDRAGGRSKRLNGEVAEVATVAARQRGLTEEGVREAFSKACDGFGTDVVLADPGLNARFVDHCEKLGLVGDPRTWNHLLLIMRKRGKSSGLAPAVKRIEMSWESYDKFSFASEIALKLVLKRGIKSLDQVLCDPVLLTEFDRLAGRFAPDFTPFEYRWAALARRKAARLALSRSASLSPPTEPEGRFRIDRPENFEDLAEGPGIYVVESETDPFYVGEAVDLKHRLRRKFGTPDLRGLWKERTGADHLFIRVFRPTSRPRLLLEQPGLLLAWQKCFLSVYNAPLNLGRPA